MSSAAAHVFAALSAIVVVFQIVLAFGAPWGALTWGGKYPGKLPPRMRAVAIISAMLLFGFAVVVEIRAGLLLPEWQQSLGSLVWLVVGYSGLGVVANAMTRSRWERIIWLPVALAMLASSLVVALGGSSQQ